MMDQQITERAYEGEMPEADGPAFSARASFGPEALVVTVREERLARGGETVEEGEQPEGGA